MSWRERLLINLALDLAGIGIGLALLAGKFIALVHVH